MGVSMFSKVLGLIPILGKYIGAAYEAGNNIIKKNEIINRAISFNAIS